MKYRLRDLRVDRDLTQEDLANLLNMTRQNYARIENEMVSLSFDNAIIISNFYGISPEELIKNRPLRGNITRSEYEQIKAAAILILSLEERIK